MTRIDIVTVFHNDTNFRQHEDLRRAIETYEPDGVQFIAVDNRVKNRGFALACNMGAFDADPLSPIIGFINPDAVVNGPFVAKVEKALIGPVVITGCRYGKSERELRYWRVRDWVCGAAMFVTRQFFTDAGGFDPQFIWSHEELDLIRQAESQGLVCRSIDLPIDHRSPDVNSPEDTAYKQRHFQQAAVRYQRKWGRH